MYHFFFSQLTAYMGNEEAVFPPAVKIKSELVSDLFSIHDNFWCKIKNQIWRFCCNKLLYLNKFDKIGTLISPWICCFSKWIKNVPWTTKNNEKTIKILKKMYNFLHMLNFIYLFSFVSHWHLFWLIYFHCSCNFTTDWYGELMTEMPNVLMVYLW